jgi:hypothetical protein
MNSVMIPWALEIGIINYRTLSGQRDSIISGGQGLSLKNVKSTGPKRPALPSELLASVIAYGTFSIIADWNPRIGGLLAWGITIATFMVLAGSAPPTTNAQAAQLQSGQAILG